MNNATLAIFASGSIASFLFLSGPSLSARAESGSSAESMMQLKAKSLAALSKQDPHAKELVTRATSFVETVKGAKSNSPLPAKLERAVQHITHGSASASDAQI